MLNTFGKGRVLFLPLPFFKAYRSSRSPWLKELFRQLVVGVLGVSKRIEVEAPVSVKLVLMQDQLGWLLHLIYLQKETDSMYLDASECRGPIRVRVSPGWEVSRVYTCLRGNELSARRDGKWTVFTVPSITIHGVIRIERQEARTGSTLQ